MSNFPAPRTLLSLVLLSLLAAGCATNRAPATALYKQTQNETVYRARPINLGSLFKSGGIGQDPQVLMRAWATCSGENCQPRKAWVAFSLQQFSKEMQITSDRSVSIETDEEVYSWRHEHVTGFSAPKHGEIARISLDMSTVKDVATTRHFRGKIGDQDFSLSYEDREPLRALLEKIRHPSPKGGTS